jgi:predicted nucleic acid-binding protein
VSGFVLDASTALSWCFRDEKSEQNSNAFDRIAFAERVFVTSFWWYEVMNAFLYAERRNRITAAITSEFLGELGSIQVVVDVPPSEMIIGVTQKFCRKHALTAYDAAYLELAMREQVPLATLDRDLRKAAQAENVETL